MRDKFGRQKDNKRGEREREKVVQGRYVTGSPGRIMKEYC